MLSFVRERWSVIVGVLCGAQLLVAMFFLGAGLGAFVSVEGGVVVVAFGIAVAGAIKRRQRSSSIEQSTPAG